MQDAFGLQTPARTPKSSGGSQDQSETAAPGRKYRHVVMENVRCGTHQVIKIPRRKLSSLLHMMCKVWFLGQLFFMVGLEVVQSVTGNCISSESAFPGEPLE